MAIYVTCGKCGNYLGSAATMSDAEKKNLEHRVECSTSTRVDS